jgi:membrane-associated HD superfamily phosphohydrolase
MNQWFRKRFLLLIAAEFVVVLAIAFAFATKHLSARAFGVVGLLNMVALFVAVLLLSRRAQEKIKAEDALLPPATAREAQVQRLERGIKASKRMMIAFSLFLIYSELVNWNSSPKFRIFGAVFDLAFIAMFYDSMRRAKAKLKALGETE